MAWELHFALIVRPDAPGCPVGRGMPLTVNRFMSDLAGYYDSAFYRGQSGSSQDAARAILPLVLEVVRPASMVDVGCGVGTWLAAAGELGVTRLMGLEGPWVKPSDLLDPRITLVTHDLEQPIAVTERFDLAMSVEVAEHVSRARADALAKELCALSDCLLFGAAIPGQGGTNHINEQWQSFWADRFAAEGFAPLDLVRPAFWKRHEIPVHYRQNTILFVHERRRDEIAARCGERVTHRWEIDLVHPEVHLANYDELVSPPTISKALRSAADLPGAVGRSLRKRLSHEDPRGQP